MLRFNQPLQCAALQPATPHPGWHKPELTGLWSSQTTAALPFPLEERVRARGGVLIVECVGIPDGKPEQWLELDVVGVGKRRVAVVDRSIHMLTFILPPDQEGALLLRLTVSRLTYVPEVGGERPLGGLIKSVRVVPRRASVFGPPTLEAPLVDGFASIALPRSVLDGYRIEAFQEGRVFVSGAEDGLWTAATEGGVIEAPPQVARQSRSMTFLPDEPGALQPLVTVTCSGAERGAPWNFLFTAHGAVIEDVKDVGAGYRQAAMTLTRPRDVDVEGPMRVLIAADRGRFTWRVRPRYGAAWTMLQDAGSFGEDARGPFRTGPIAGAGELWPVQEERRGRADPGGPAQAALLRGLVQACVAGLEGGAPRGSKDFFLDLLRAI